jgi:hypothetical protein
MRLIMVAAPEGMGGEVAQKAFSVGIEKVSRRSVESQHADGKVERKDVVDIETSTPLAKRFKDALLSAEFFNREDFTISVRAPRSIVSATSLYELTKPLVETPGDILEELWQFSHITYGFVGRVLIAAGFLAYGLIHQKTLLIIAGLLFLPLLPLLLAVGYGILAKRWKLAGQGALAFLVATVLLVLGGVAVASVSEPPLRYDDFNTLLVSFLISAAVGVAGVLANIDDVGRREMIGLAATAQIAIIPVWFGISLLFGFPPTTGESEISSRALAFAVNVLTIIVTSLAVYYLTGAARQMIPPRENK